jgi:RNA ligase
MFYPFPIIKNIKQVREAVGDRKEFIITEKPGGYIVANYLVCLPDTFPDIKLNSEGQFASREDMLYAIRRECRGIKFDVESGHIIARPFHKFFNANERAETQLDVVFAEKEIGDGSHIILDKLDGSMIHPILTPYGIHWCTKMGITEVAKPVEAYVMKNPQYLILAKECIAQQLTPIFEWCSRKQRIVLDYPTDRLVLIAIRDNYTGDYLPLSAMHGMTHNVNIECIKALSVLDIAAEGQDFIEAVRAKTGLEGYVIRFNSGHMLKLKAEEYLKIHKAKDGLTFEKNVIDLIINEKIDDVRPFLQEADLKRIKEFEEDFWKGTEFFIADLNSKYFMGKLMAKDDKKKFAVEFVMKQNGFYKAFLFQMWDGKEARELVLNYIKDNTGSQKQVDDMRKIFGAKWNVEEVSE